MLGPDDLRLLHVFQAVAQEGSFTAAAAKLRISKSGVSESIKALETRLGVILLERTTRRLRITELGAHVLETAEGVEALLRNVTEVVGRAKDAPSGHLRVACTVDLGTVLVAPAVARFVREHPLVRVEVVSDDTPRDLVEAGIDVAVRLGGLHASSFTLRRLASFSEPIVCAPIVAAQLGNPTRPRDLAGASWVRHSILKSSRTLKFTGPGGSSDEVTPDVRAEANTGLALLSLLLSGAGVGCLPDYLLREHLASHRLVRLCEGWSWKVVHLHALLPSRAAIRPVHRAFVEALEREVATSAARWGRGPV
jgi:DNA-binding transcriptional LysR family regulator